VDDRRQDHRPDPWPEIHVAPIYRGTEYPSGARAAVTRYNNRGWLARSRIAASTGCAEEDVSENTVQDWLQCSAWFSDLEGENCAHALFNIGMVPLPTHVCDDVALQSVDRYQRRHAELFPDGSARLAPVPVALEPTEQYGLCLERQVASGAVLLVARLTMTEPIPGARLADDELPNLHTHKRSWGRHDIVQLKSAESGSANVLVPVDEALSTWYKRTLLGRRIGRPPASGYWEDCETFVADARAVALKLWPRHKQYLTLVHIWREMPASESTCKAWWAKARDAGITSRSRLLAPP